jgi:DMSO/TMAO reductase YedYZ molybdopterin-dependent catalytic subunit
MTRGIHRIGGRIVEIPVSFVERTSGRSKLSRRIVLEALYRVTVWGLKDRSGSLSRRRSMSTPWISPSRSPRLHRWRATSTWHQPSRRRP